MFSRFTLFVALLALFSCGDRERSDPDAPQSSKILDAYSRIEPGMARIDVEKITGAPVFPPTEGAPGSNEVIAWYLDVPERGLEEHESPWGPAGIKVVYREGKVVEKKYNHQWVPREAREAFEDKRED